MSEAPKLLTADEKAQLKRNYGHITWSWEARAVATIEQQQEQIEKLREALFEQRTCFSGDTRATILRILSDAEYDQWMSVDKRSDKVLTATEPVNDKR